MERLAWLQRSWATLGQVVAWVGGVIGAFLAFHVVLDPRLPVEGNDEVAFVRFAGALASGLILLACNRWRLSRHTRRWVSASIALLVLSAALFFAYNDRVRQWTGVYAGLVVVAGDALTAEAQQFQAKLNRQVTNDQLLLDAAGQADLVWPRSGRVRHFEILAGLYGLAWISSAMCLICTLQAMRCEGVLSD